MPRFKNETLSIRTTAEIKDLRHAAGREQRSVASMIEPDFGVTSVHYDLAELLARAEVPQ
jgi:hypothetical protein